MLAENFIVLSGAGVSAESGIPTFRDAGGLWHNHAIEEVATPEAWATNPQRVLDFYNWRRHSLLKAKPNAAHYLIARLEQYFNVQVITQNVDDLHERAGSTQVLHLHGELRKVRSCGNPEDVLPWDGPLRLSDRCRAGHPLRPHIVWFGEEVVEINRAMAMIPTADMLLVIGTSLQVYPAAGLLGLAPPGCRIFYLDPDPGPLRTTSDWQVRVIAAPATVGMKVLYEELGLPTD